MVHSIHRAQDHVIPRTDARPDTHTSDKGITRHLLRSRATARATLLLITFGFALGACNTPPNSSSALPSNNATNTAPQSWPHGGMVSAANPYAAKAAADVLRNGGHAVDAAIAAHTVLGLVEPQSSGIGGGAFMLVFDRAANKLTAYNGRERAPQSANGNLFAGSDGNTIGFRDAWQGGVSTGVPGSIALYKLAHESHGKLPWQAPFAAAIQLAETGFVVSPRLAGFLPRMAQYTRLDEDLDAANYFFPNGEPLAAGTIRTNADYAETLSRVAKEGPSAFYTGVIAKGIIAATSSNPLPGKLSLEDLANYEAIAGDALCYQTRIEKLCTVQPPSSGLAALSMVALYDLLVPENPTKTQQIVAFVDAQRLAYADRDHYIGDPEFSAIPVADLLNPDYLAARAQQRFAPDAVPSAGDPGAILRAQPMLSHYAADRPTETSSTTHFSIIDQQGNAVAMTASVEAPFGNSRFVHGFLLNNQLTDFRRDADGKAHANAPEPRKRPRSSMSPVMAFAPDGSLKLVTGSPGGNSIIAYVAKSLLASLRWNLSDEASVAAPNIVARGNGVRVETATDAGKELAAALQELGYPVQKREGENSGLHLIRVGSGGLTGAADPRREGEVIAVP